MSRFSRINAIWRKELTDTLRDRRTVIAMVLVPIVLYPGMILASLMAIEYQSIQLKSETYRVGVRDEDTRRWLRRIIDTDPARHPDLPGSTAEERIETARRQSAVPPPAPADDERGAAARTRLGARQLPPEYEVVVTQRLEEAVRQRDLHAALVVDGPLPTPDDDHGVRVAVIRKEKDVRSDIAAAGLEGILTRVAARIVQERLAKRNLAEALINPIELVTTNVATELETQGWLAGLMIPPILIILTITGTIYPAIDLTAGERERGTLETLMVAPVPTVDLIAGKFVVVTLIGLISAFLNLLAFGGTMYLGGLSALLTSEWNMRIPLSALPWVMLALVPLAVLFGALLLAVSSFARSFKEAQNYVMPVIMGAMLPAFISVIPGTKLEGPVLIMPVGNIVVLTRELFIGHFRWDWIFWVVLSTSLYATAAVAVAARLFGQEAVLFADTSSIRAMFVRKFYKPRATPATSQALLLLALAYPLNFFVQNALAQAGWLRDPTGALAPTYFLSLAVWFTALFLFMPAAVAAYSRTAVLTTLALRRPPLVGLAGGLLLGLSTWVIALWWYHVQSAFLPIDEQVQQQQAALLEGLSRMHPAVIVLLLAVVPALCEELFFRGYVLSGVMPTFGRYGGAVLVAVAFGIFHQGVHRLILTIVLGLLLALLVVRTRSIWPAILAHLMHNALSTLAGDDRVTWLRRLAPWLSAPDAIPPPAWVVFAVAASAAGVLLALMVRPPDDQRSAHESRRRRSASDVAL